MLNDRTRTSAYLASISKAVRPGDVVLDIGTSTGVFAIAAAQAGARHVYAIEAGSIAEAASTLFEVNGVADRITLIRDLSTRIILGGRTDVLAAELIGDDPLAKQVIGITRDAMMRLLKPDARLVTEQHQDIWSTGYDTRRQTRKTHVRPGHATEMAVLVLWLMWISKRVGAFELTVRKPRQPRRAVS